MIITPLDSENDSIKTNMLSKQPFYKQTNIIPSGCQTTYVQLINQNGGGIQSFSQLVDSNTDYYIIAGSLALNIFNINSNTLKSIFSPGKDSIISCVKLSNDNKIAMYSKDELNIYCINKESLILNFDLPKSGNSSCKILFMDFSKDNNFLLMTVDNSNSGIQILDIKTKKITSYSILASIAKFNFLPNKNNSDIILSLNNNITAYNLINRKITNNIVIEQMCCNEGEIIIAIKWYKLEDTDNLVLIGSTYGRIWLVSLNEKEVVKEFYSLNKKFNKDNSELKSKEVVGLYWLPNKPGLFIASYYMDEFLYLYNVSSSNCIKKIKAANYGIIRLCPIIDSNRYNIKSSSIYLLCLENASSIIFNIDIEDQLYKLEASHSETIFDIKSFYNKETNSNILLSCGYDENIKIWSLNKGTLIKNIKLASNLNSNFQQKKSRNIEVSSNIVKGNYSFFSYFNNSNRYVSSNKNTTLSSKLIAYCISLSPKYTNDNLVLVGDNLGSIRLINTKKGIQVEEFSTIKHLENNKLNKMKSNDSLNLDKKKTSSIFDLNVSVDFKVIITGISWVYNYDNECHSILTSSKNVLFLLTLDNNNKLSFIKSYKFNKVDRINNICHNPFEFNKCCVPFDSGKIAVFDYNKEQELNILNNHSKNVFSVIYHNKIPNLIASSSNDCNVVVNFNINNKDIDINKISCKNEVYRNIVLKGHTNYTRKLLFHDVYHNILFSSSWDGTIRIWNINVGECVRVITENYSDVYGLCLDPMSTNTLISCGRDNTIRSFNICYNYKTELEYIMFCLNNNILFTNNINELTSNIKDHTIKLKNAFSNTSDTNKNKLNNNNKEIVELTILPKAIEICNHFYVSLLVFRLL